MQKRTRASLVGGGCTFWGVLVISSCWVFVLKSRKVLCDLWVCQWSFVSCSLMFFCRFFLNFWCAALRAECGQNARRCWQGALGFRKLRGAAGKMRGVAGSVRSLQADVQDFFLSFGPNKRPSGVGLMPFMATRCYSSVGWSVRLIILRSAARISPDDLTTNS